MDVNENPWAPRESTPAALLARAYALICHAEEAASDLDSLAGSQLVVMCQEAKGTLRDCQAPLDADLMSVPPPSSDLRELLLDADAQLDRIPPADRHPELLLTRARLIEAATFTEAGHGHQRR